MYKYQIRKPEKEGAWEGEREGKNSFERLLHMQRIWKAMHMPRTLYMIRKDLRRCLAFTSGSALGSLEEGSES